MKILKGAIESLGSDGYITLQIPQYDLSFDGHTYETEEVPDKWVAWVRMKNGKLSQAIGRERGFLYLTQIGWAANKDKIKKSFEKSKTARGTWDEFEYHASKYFQQLRNDTLYKITKLKAKIVALEDTLKES